MTPELIGLFAWRTSRGGLIGAEEDVPSRPGNRLRLSDGNETLLGVHGDTTIAWPAVTTPIEADPGTSRM
jgi:hypothetical protein